MKEKKKLDKQTRIKTKHRKTNFKKNKLNTNKTKT